jgi:hypothetical protein
MPAPDIEALALRALRPLGSGRVQVVEAAEEQRGVGQVGECLDALVDLMGEGFRVDPVRGDVPDVERLDVLAHRTEGGAGVREVGALAEEGVVGEGVVGRGVGHGGVGRGGHG